MKILHIINSLSPAGAETLLANSLAKEGFPKQCKNVLIYLKGSSHLIERIDKKVDVINLNYKGFWDLPRLLFELRKKIKQINPSIIHAHLNPCNVYVKLVKPQNIPLFYTLHTTITTDIETSRFRKLMDEYLFFKKNVNIIQLSDFCQNEFFKFLPLFKGNSYVVNNFIENRFFDKQKIFLTPRKIKKQFVAITRYSAGKNLEYLINIFKSLNPSEYELHVYGNGNKSSYENLIKENRVANVFLNSAVTNVPETLLQYDAFISATKNEGFPLSHFEAMAVGLPLFLSNIAPVKSVVKDYATYFDLTDAEAAAKIIETAFNNTQVLIGRANEAVEYAKQTVTLDKYVNALMKLYELKISK